ncbi:hypothetical protein SFRURICE_015874 [Spodoptera frugiperda]|uniref:SFRICE_010961 n=1 Tax=Spodoptera frugiperda TaxID=7108 RepID=A0A2H1WB64_SPOFR|nr:hypothetical protein SFRURICE_015874 [Spodoptera frugiperda]
MDITNLNRGPGTARRCRQSQPRRRRPHMFLCSCCYRALLLLAEASNSDPGGSVSAASPVKHRKPFSG